MFIESGVVEHGECTFGKLNENIPHHHLNVTKLNQASLPGQTSSIIHSGFSFFFFLRPHIMYSLTQT